MITCRDWTSESGVSGVETNDAAAAVAGAVGAGHTAVDVAVAVAVRAAVAVLGRAPIAGSSFAHDPNLPIPSSRARTRCLSIAAQPAQTALHLGV